MEPLENDEVQAQEPSRWEGLKTRIVSGIVLAAVLLGIVWHGGWLFTLLVLIAAMIMVKEWNSLTKNDGPGWHLGGMFYAAIPCASLIWLRDLQFVDDFNGGRQVVLYVFFTVWATDIGAYIVGRRFGRFKLAPALSPGKTWEGLGGGVLAAALIGGISHSFVPFPASMGGCIVMGALLAVVSQAGDLFESWIKRRADVKDSGTLIPGHGGLLDRIDGLVFAIPFYALALMLSGMLPA